jgi:hypothetical protein
METEFGSRIVRFCEQNAFGVLDHAVYREGDEPITMPLRVTANGEGCDLSFIFFRRPGVSDEEFASAIEWVTTDFLGLKELLEVQPPATDLRMWARTVRGTSAAASQPTGTGSPLLRASRPQSGRLANPTLERCSFSMSMAVFLSKGPSSVRAPPT